MSESIKLVVLCSSTNLGTIITVFLFPLGSFALLPYGVEGLEDGLLVDLAPAVAPDGPQHEHQARAQAVEGCLHAGGEFTVQYKPFIGYPLGLVG